MEGLPDVPTMDEVMSLVNQVQGRRSALQDNLQQVEREVESLRDEQSLLEHVAALFRQLIDAEISDAVESLEGLQSEALHTVFDDQELSVEAKVGVERGKVSVDLITKKQLEDGTVQRGVSRESFGGSVTTVESVILRVLVLIKRDMRRLLLLDEALPAFNPRYAANMGSFLVALCDRLGMDVLMITHNPTFVDNAHRSYRVRQHKKDTARFDLVHEVKR